MCSSAASPYLAEGNLAYQEGAFLGEVVLGEASPILVWVEPSETWVEVVRKDQR